MLDQFLYWKNIKPGKNPPEAIFAIIECPRGTRNKYELSKNSNLLILDRVLHSSVTYPHDYGLIPGTYAEDGDPLDILVLISNPTVPLTIINSKPIGILLMEDEQGLDEKIVAIAKEDPFYETYNKLSDLPEHYMNEIKEFFQTYKNLEEPKYSEITGWDGIEKAKSIINESIKRFKDKFGDIALTTPY